MRRGSSPHPISLASGVMPDASPLQAVRAAAAAGFDAVGLWLDMACWNAQRTRDVRRALADADLPLLDIEVLWIRPGALDPDHLRALDVAVELGVANALFVSSDPDRAATARRFSALCEHAAATRRWLAAVPSALQGAA